MCWRLAHMVTILTRLVFRRIETFSTGSVRSVYALVPIQIPLLYGDGTDPPVVAVHGSTSVYCFQRANSFYVSYRTSNSGIYATVHN